ncbi:MAG: 50S ribosomal protein L11 methyltransferase [bacterium]
MNRKYKNLKLTFDKDYTEMVSGILGYLLNPDGIEETEVGKGSVCINIYISYDATVTDEHLRQLIKENLSNIEYELEIKAFEYDPATETAWKKYFKPQKIGKNVVIKPSWEEYKQKDGDIVVTIDPGAAFGTGLHETTRGVIVLLEEIVELRKNNKENLSTLHMLDAGTGSGILAIAAHKMGIGNILAVDNDREAVETTEENIIANNITSGIAAEQNTIEDVKENDCYDIILANIIPEVLIRNKAGLFKMLRKNGDLVLSGILAKEENKVVEEFLDIKGLELHKRVQLEEWTSLWFRSE